MSLQKQNPEIRLSSGLSPLLEETRRSPNSKQPQSPHASCGLALSPSGDEVAPISNVTDAQPVRRSPRKSSSNGDGHESEFVPCQFNEKDREEAVRFYSYLKSRNVKHLQLIAKRWKLTISARNKEQIIARCMVYVFVLSEKGIRISDLLRKNRSLNDYKVWVDNAIQSCTTWEILPEIQTLMSKLHLLDQKPAANAVRVAMKKNNKAENAAGETNANFSLNEFARLLVLLRDDNRCRYALLRACGTELTKEELGCRITREAFWGVIAQRFNNNLVDSKEDFTGNLEEVDSNARALCERTGSVLKERFYEARRDFTEVYHRWSASGQNDPDRIVAFLGLSGSGDYTMESKRALVMFLVCRVGTPQEETNLLQLTSKLIDNGEGGLDEGVHGSTANASGETKSHKRRSTELQGSLDEMSKSLSNFTGYVKQQLENQREKSEKGLKRDRNNIDDDEEEERLAGKLLTSAERYQRSLEIGDSEVQQMLQGVLSRSKKRLKKFCDERMGGDDDKHI